METVVLSDSKSSKPESGGASAYLAGMSHDLRSPLNAIIGMAELLKDGLVGELSPDQADCINDIWNSSRSLLTMIEDMLDVARLDSGQALLHTEEHDIPALLDECMTEARELGVAKAVNIAAAVDPRLAAGTVDARMLKKTILALAASAIAASPRGGHIELAFSRAAAEDTGRLSDGTPGHVIPFHDGEPGFFLKIACRDAGETLTAAQAERLFDRLDRPGGRTLSGSGNSRPGLALARMLARLQRGAVAAEAAPGGACIYAWVPLQASGAVPSASSSSTMSTALPK